MIETWALLLFICSRESPRCETIEFGHYDSRETCVATMNRELERVRRFADRNSGAVCVVVEEKSKHT